MHHELDQHQERHLPRHRVKGRSATVTPSVNSAQGADAFCRNCSSRSSATGGFELHRRRSDAERGRDHERVQQDLPRHVERIRGRALR